MRTILIGAAALTAIALMGCDRVKALLGDNTHSPPPVAEPASTPAAAPSSGEPAGSDLYTQLKAKEKALIAASNGQVERVGTVLTFKVDGVPVATFNDGDWMLTSRFNGVNSAGQPDHFFIFALLEATDTQHYSLIIDSQGVPVTWVPEDVLVFGDGPLFAAGTTGLDSGPLEIDDWSTAKHLSASFDGSCLPEKWLSATELAVDCSNEVNGEYKMTVKKVSATTWQYQPDHDKAKAKPTQPFDKDQMDFATKAGFRQLKAG